MKALLASMPVPDTYLLNNVHPNRASLDSNDNLDVATLDSLGGFQMMVANDKDYLPTRTSYKLNLRGPSINVHTACSTALVTVHLAFKVCSMANVTWLYLGVPQSKHRNRPGIYIKKE